METRAKELEAVISQEEDNEDIMKQFQEEISRFASLEITDEAMLRELFQRLIERIEIAVDGSITIHYNFKNPLLLGA